MNKTKTILLRFLLKKILTVFIIAFFSLSAYATNYYVNATNGNDSNSGLSPALAWKTLNRVNQGYLGFIGGDSVLFKKGEVWSGALGIWSSGSNTKQLVFSSYGSGNKPLINALGIEQGAICIYAGSYVTINGFAVTNFDGLDIYDGTEADRCGIRVGQWKSVNTNIKIVNNEIFFVEGFSNSPHVVGAPRGTVLDQNTYNQYQNAAIYFRGDTAHSLTIERNYVHDCTTSGIIIFPFGRALNLLIQQNSIYNVGADGIELLACTNPLIQLNACINAANNSGEFPRGPGVLGYNGMADAGMWSFNSTDPVFQYNYCEGTKKIKYDGQAWDYDMYVTGGVYQYNYSRDNEGGFNIGGTPDQLFRYNISYNDGSKQGTDGEGFVNGNPTYYNNIFYRDDSQGFQIESFINSGRRDFINNIFYTNATTDITYDSGPTGATFSNNCYYGHTPVNPGTASINTNPMFIGGTPGKILPGVIFTINDLRNTVAGLKLQAGSPCINKGQNMANNGGLDFWSNSLYSATADIGAYEYSGVTTGISFEKNSSEVIVYPNPFHTGFYVKILYETELKDAVMKIYDLCGKEVRNVSIVSHETTIDREGLSNGVYFYTIINNNEKIANVRLSDIVGQGKLVVQ